LTGTFAYSVTNLIEVGIDLFATYERMHLTRRPALNAFTYGALLGMRFQHQFEIGPRGLMPSVGVLGPRAHGGGHPGPHPQVGLRFEYRLLVAKGETEDLGTYEAAGNWFSVGLNYQFPSEPGRPMGRHF
jgi:hypothetical protein